MSAGPWWPWAVFMAGYASCAEHFLLRRDSFGWWCLGAALGSFAFSAAAIGRGMRRGRRYR